MEINTTFDGCVGFSNKKISIYREKMSEKINFVLLLANTFLEFYF